MPPNSAQGSEQVFLHRQHTIATLEARLRALAVGLSDAEVLRLVHAMLDERAKATGRTELS